MNYVNRILTVLNKPIKQGEPRWTYYKSVKVICGQEIGFRVPSNLSIVDAEKALPALVATCGKDIELIGYKGLVVCRIIEKDFPKKQPADPKDLKTDKLLIGYDRLLKPVYHPLNVHMLVAGAARSGKTDALRWFVFQFIIQKYDVYICDMKEISFFPFEGLVTVAKSLAKSCEVLEKGVAELNRRKKLVGENRSRDIIEKFQPRVIVIDEAAALAPSQYKAGENKDLAWRCDNAIGLLGQQAREFKIFIVYATQRPDMSIINKLFKATVEASIAFRTKDGTNSQIIIDRVGAENISPDTPGRCIYAYDRDYLLQVPYIGGDREWNKLLAPLKTEVVKLGSSKRKNEERQTSEGIYTHADSYKCTNESPIQGKFLALKEGKPTFSGTGTGKADSVRMAQARKTVEADYERIETHSEFTDEI